MPIQLPPRKWQISAPGFAVGPYDEPYLVEAIARGDLLEGHCRPVGELRWRRLKEEPRFAEALRRSATTASVRIRRSSRSG